MVELIHISTECEGGEVCLDGEVLPGSLGKQRMKEGSNDNPNVATFLKNTSSLWIQGSVAMKPLRGNC